MRTKSINGCWCYTSRNQDILIVVKTTRRPVRNTLISSSMQHIFSLTSQTKQLVSFLKKWKMEKFKRNWHNNFVFHKRWREAFKLRKLYVYVACGRFLHLEAWRLSKSFHSISCCHYISCIPPLCKYVIVFLYYL